MSYYNIRKRKDEIKADTTHGIINDIQAKLYGPGYKTICVCEACSVPCYLSCYLFNMI